MRNGLSPSLTSSSSKVEEFLRFKQQQSLTSLASTLRTAHPDREQQHRKQEQMKQLRQRNQRKQAELNAYQRQYEKLSMSVRDAIYQLKTQQDSVDSHIDQLRKQRKQQKEGGAESDFKQRLSDLTMQLQLCQTDKSERIQRYNEDVEKMDQLIEQQKKQFDELGQKLGENQQWLLRLQQKHQNKQEPIDLRSIKNEIELLKASNGSIVKEQTTEVKRFRKDAEDVRRQLKEYTEKSEERMKGWHKKCEAVMDGKKEWRQVLPQSYYAQKLPMNLTDIEVESQYLGQLQAVGMLYEPELRNELGSLGLLSPYSVKVVPYLPRQSQTFDRSALKDMEQQLRLLDKECKQYSQQIATTDQDIDIFRQKIDKDDRQIAALQQSIDAKKRR